MRLFVLAILLIGCATIPRPDLSPEAVLRSNWNALAQLPTSLIERLVPREAAPVPPSRRLDATQILQPLLAEPSYLRV